MAARRALAPLARQNRTDAVRRLAQAVAAQQELLWDLVDGWMQTGSQADELAEAMGLSRRTFYDRLARHRKQGPGQAFLKNT